MADRPTYLFPSDVAELLQVSVKTVNRWSNEGRLPFVRTLGGHKRYEEKAIRELLEQHTVPVTNHHGRP